MKKWFLATAVVACVLITGCAGSHEDEATPQAPPQAKACLFYTSPSPRAA
ncbi:hypothetical protein [Helicobacter heilmannii]|nr:hypothetical protein [Helicobacter heilmannii]